LRIALFSGALVAAALMVGASTAAAANFPVQPNIVAGALAAAANPDQSPPGTNNFDLGIYKALNITERVKFRFGAQFGNIVNHPQFIPGSNPGFGLGVNDVNSFASVGASYKSYVNPAKANFNNPRSVFASNARTIALTAKFTF